MQPMGRGEEARAGLGETGQTGTEEQLSDPSPALGALPHCGQKGSGSCGPAGDSVMAVGVRCLWAPSLLLPFPFKVSSAGHSLVCRVHMCNCI